MEQSAAPFMRTEKYARLERQRREQIWTEVKRISPFVWMWISHGRRRREGEQLEGTLRRAGLSFYCKLSSFEGISIDCSIADIERVFKYALEAHWERLYSHITADLEAALIPGREAEIPALVPQSRFGLAASWVRSTTARIFTEQDRLSPLVAIQEVA